MPRKADTSAAQFWRRLGLRFKDLVNEEQRENSAPLKAYTTVNASLKREICDWRVDDCCRTEIRSQFELLGMQGGKKLCVLTTTPPPNPLHYWLHRLFQYLWEQESLDAVYRLHSISAKSKLRIELSSILRLNRASIAFCSSLERQALEAGTHRKAVGERFKEWIENNNSVSASPAWVNFTDRDLVSRFAKNATTTIPIEFLSASLNILGNFRKVIAQGSPRQTFDMVANRHGLVWGVTENGLWMAVHPPEAGAYFGSKGLVVQPESNKPRRGRPITKLTMHARSIMIEDPNIDFEGFVDRLNDRYEPEHSDFVGYREMRGDKNGKKLLRNAHQRAKP